MSESLQTPTGILSFPHLFTPKPPAVNADPRYSCILVFTPDVQDSDEYKALVRMVKKTAKEQWKDDMPSGLRSPIRDASEKPKHFGSFPKGTKFVSLWRKADSAPAVVDANVQRITTPGDVFAGQLARASFSPFAYSNSGNNGVGLYLNNIQICKADMERLDGRMAAEDEFGKVGGAASADDFADDGDLEDERNPFG